MIRATIGVLGSRVALNHMRVFVYEFVSGGGMWSTGNAPLGSLLSEGRAMAQSIVADFEDCGADVWSMLDTRLVESSKGQVERVGSAEQERDAFLRLTAAADWTVVIAPEFEGNLLRRCQWVLEAGGRMLSPGPGTVALASDKQKTADHLAVHGIRVPSGMRLAGPSSVSNVPLALFPAVIKPLDGCGSRGVQRVDRAVQLGALVDGTPQRLERFIPGLPASLAVLCGPNSHVPLPACEQILSGDGRFSYLGGRTPLPTLLDERAQKHALLAVRTLPDPLGYVGVDLVLGTDLDGRDDHVIEINPRLTTSYAGLRALCRANLAAAMLAVAEGQVPALSWHDGVVEFSADGRVNAIDRTVDESTDR